jgi:hypothetical protein
MTESNNKKPTDAQREAVEFLTRPRPGMETWRKAREAEVAAWRIANPEIGDVMKDGSIYAGISPETQERMYVTAEDARLSMDFNKATEYAEKLNAHGHQGWRLPTKDELNVLFENQDKGALKGTFKLASSNPKGPYWSSTPDGDRRALLQMLSTGISGSYEKFLPSSVRCVRSGIV